MLALYLTKFEYGSFSYDKSFKACVLAQKKLSKSKSIDEIKIFCETEIKKNLNK